MVFIACAALLLAAAVFAVAGWVVVRTAQTNRQAVLELPRVADKRAEEAMLGAKAITDGYRQQETEQLRLAREQMQLDQQRRDIMAAAQELAETQRRLEGKTDHLPPADRRATGLAQAGIAAAHQMILQQHEPPPPPPPRPRNEA